MTVEDWVRTATRPTQAEVDAVVRPLHPALVAHARIVTAPTATEVAALRPRVREARGAPVVPLGLAAALAAGLALWVGRVEPPVEVEVVAAEAGAQPGVYVVSPGAEVVPVQGVRVRGAGRVEVRADGHLVLDGALELAIDAPVSFEVDGAAFTAERARLVLDGARVDVADGTVTAPDRTLSAGDQWEAVVRRVVAAPERAPIVAPTPVEADVALPAPEPAPAPLGEDLVAWREVLAVLEGGGTRAARRDAVAAYLEAHPGSPFAEEAEALRLLLRAPGSGPAAGALDEIEAWLARHPGSARGLELHALAAGIARNELQDCARAEPHDWVVARTGSAGAAAEARAFLGLCAAAAGRGDQAAALLGEVDRTLLPPALRDAVGRAVDR